MSGTEGGGVELPTRADLADELEIVADAMQHTGERMEYLGGFGELGKHGRKMMDDARKAGIWVERLRATERGRG